MQQKGKTIMKRKWKHASAAVLCTAAALCGVLPMCSASMTAAAVGIAQPSPKTNIGDEDMGFYEALLTRAKSVADGECVSTEFVIPVEELNRSSYRYSAADLGTELVVGGSISQKAYDEICEIYYTSLNKALSTLNAEAPYELFWYDGTKGYGCCDLFEIGYEQDANGTGYLTVSGSYEIDMSVADEYAAGEFAVDPNAISRAHDAVAYADAIIEKYEDESDMDKLIAYKDEICALSSYNYDALENSGYGGAYQMIYVFDQDPDTKVVCEGYSKAFQYLCDNTEFMTDITCILATGYFCGTSDADLHMWNVVSDANGNNFIADVTNSHPDMIGNQGDLFLKGCTSGSLEAGYTFTAYDEQIPYLYDADTLELYDAEMLELAPVGTRFVCSEEAPAPVELKITGQPESVSAAVGGTALFTVAATGKKLTYQWQYNAGSGWKKSGAAGNQTDTLSISSKVTYHGYQYRCVITDKYGNSVISDAARLLVKPAVQKQPANLSATVGTAAKFTVSAVGVGTLTYQWQYNKGDGWKNSNGTGAKTATLTISTAAGYNGYQYRCIVTDENGRTATSSAAKLTVKTAITAQPAGLSKAVGTQAIFTVTATGAGLKYQWQYNKGDGWKTSNGTGSKTGTLTINTAAGYNNYQYRCVITDANGAKTISAAAKLTVQTAITAQPADASAAINEAAKFTVKATGAGLKYQWQYNSGDGWKNSGASGNKTASLTLYGKTTYNGWQFRCVITDANGKTTTSGTAVFRVRTAITAQPADVEAASGTAAKFTVKATGIGLSYQWQYNSGSGWKNSGASGAATATLTINAKTAYDGWQYRCVITDGNGAKTISDDATLTLG